jgi:malonate-semialdehyde dehydrogenase (acetylating) / methylmalonate-semialdehyde dehydrogenase
MRSLRLIQHWIDGKAWDQDPERLGDVYDPATGEIAARVAYGHAEVVDAAVAAAKDAFEAWRASSLSARTRIMFAFRELLEQHREDLARIITSEHGKVMSDAMGEVRRGIDVAEFACGIPHLLKGEFSENVSTNVNTYSIRQPLGVVVGITPFNFPVMVPMWMYPIAVACGNTFVLKPSEKDPSASILMAELFAQAGLPGGVFNVVHGDKVAVDRLLEHPDVAAISSVGSTPVARYIYERAAQFGKRVQALGGAKNHMVVLPDADMELAADSLVGAAYGSTGQRCMAVSAIVAVGEAGDRLIELVRDRVAKLKIGPGTDPDAEMGPLVTGAHRDKVASYVETGLHEGAKLVIDGRDFKVEGYEKGFFLGPCLFDQVTPDMTIYKDEIFGPVPVMLRAGSLAEAIEIVNRNPYGNGVAVFTSDGGAATTFQHQVEVGMVGINVPIPVPMAFFSFGGWKQSLFGDAHIHGPEGVNFYTRGKVVTSRWSQSMSRGVDLGFPSGGRRPAAG